MKKQNVLNTLLALSALAAAPAHAGLSVADLRSRFGLRMELFVMDAEGKRLLVAPREERLYRSSKSEGIIRFSSGFGSDDHKEVFIEGEWKVADDGHIEGSLAQYRDHKDNRVGSFKGLLKKESYKIQNMASVEWKSLLETDKTVIVRLTPTFDVAEAPQDLGGVPLSFSEASISDSRGNLWVDRLSAVGNYVGVTTHRGQLALSYKPFKGAREIGEASGHRIELGLEDQLRVSILSETAILPTGVKAKVYGLYNPGRKTPKLSSVQTSNTSKEEGFLERLAR